MAKRKWRQIDSMSDAGSPVTNDPEGPEAEVPGSRTRKARKSGGRRIHSLAPSSTASESEFSDDGHRAVRRQRELSHVKPGTLAFPRSAYEGYQPRLPVTTESQALRDLLGHLRQQRTEANERSDFGFVALEDFSVYRPPRDPRRPNELAGLEKLQVHRGASDGFLFDGILRVGTIRRYVQGVPFKIVTVEGYGDEAVTDLSDRICLQSALASRSNIWYQLGRPSREYARFYEPFLWLAEFAKHFVDYMLEMERVTLDDFRFCFHGWLTARNATCPHFQGWLAKCKLRDFRTTVSAHVPIYGMSAGAWRLATLVFSSIRFGAKWILTT